METLLIIIAIVISATLAARALMRPYKPEFSFGEKLPFSSLLYRVTLLGKRCSEVEGGAVLQGKKRLNILKRYIKAINTPKLPADVLLYNAREDVLGAITRCNKAVRTAYALGSVNGAPRLFLLCDLLVKHSSFLSADDIAEAVRVFSEYAPLTVNELSVLPDMLRFCVCGHMSLVVADMDRRSREYAAGITDGGRARIDLDRIVRPDYVCGLIESAQDIDCRSIYNSAENNGMPISEAAEERNNAIATNAAYIDGLIYTLLQIDRLSAQKLTELSAVDGILSINDDYRHGTVGTKIELLRTISRVARQKKRTESEIAREYVEKASGGADIYCYLHKNRRVARAAVCTIVPLVIAIAAALWIWLSGVTGYFILAIAAIMPVYEAVRYIISFFANVIDRYRYADLTAEDEIDKVDVYGFDELVAYISGYFSRFYLPFSCAEEKALAADDSGREHSIVMFVSGMVPTAQFVCLAVCLAGFSVTAFVAACLPSVALIAIALYRAIAEWKVLPLADILSAILRFIYLPVYVALFIYSLLVAVVCAFTGKSHAISDSRTRLYCTGIQLAVSAIFITFSAIYSSQLIVVGFVLFAGAGIMWLPKLTLGARGKTVKNKREIPDDRRLFGGETDYKINLFRGGDLFVVTDNRGIIHVRLDGARRKYGGRLEFACSAGGITLDTPNADGVFLDGQTVYRAVSEVFEFEAQLTVAQVDADGNGKKEPLCICRLALTNRTNRELNIRECARLVPFDRRTPSGYIVICGEQVKSGNGQAEICSDLPPFSYKICYISLAFTENAESAVKLASIVTEGYFHHAARYSGVYNRLENADCSLAARLCCDFECAEDVGDPTAPIVVYDCKDGSPERYFARNRLLKRYGFRFNEALITGAAERYLYDMPSECIRVSESDAAIVKDVAVCSANGCREKPSPFDCEYSAPVACGDRLPVLCSSRFDGADGYFADIGEESRNIASDGKYTIITNADGTGSSLCAQNEIFSEAGLNFVVVAQKNDTVFSPTALPCGAGEAGVYFTNGTSVYTCTHDGCRLTMRRCILRGSTAELFDITAESADGSDFSVSVMLAVELERHADISETSNGLIIKNKGGDTGLRIVSYLPFVKTAYKEGYFRHGRYVCARAFRRGGSTPAPAVSVMLDVKAEKCARAVFFAGAYPGANLPECTPEVADRIVQCERGVPFASITIMPRTSSQELNNAYVRATYRAYSYAISAGRFSVLGALALKRICPTEAKKMLLRGCTETLLNMASRGESDRAFMQCALITAIKDSVFHGSGPALLSERIAPGETIKSMTVFECCELLCDEALRISVGDNGIMTDTLLYGAISGFISVCPLDMRTTECFDALNMLKKRIERYLKANITDVSAPVCADIYPAISAALVGACSAEYIAGELFAIKNMMATEHIVYAVDDILLCAAAFYNIGDYASGYEMLSVALDRRIADGALYMTGECYDRAAILFFLIVTNRLFGINFDANNMRINPCICDGVPDIAYVIAHDGKSADITVDNSVKTGAWHMHSERITYATDKIKLTEDGVSIVFCRSGE